MRRALATLAVGVAMVGLAACGADDVKAAGGDTASSSSAAVAPSRSHPAITTSAAPPTTQPSPAPLGEAAFVRQMQASGIVPQWASADAAVELAHSICVRYDAGGTRADVMRVLTSGSLTEAQAGEFNAVAIVAFCPQYASANI